MSPNTWGPTTWLFLHTIAAKIKEDQFPTIGLKLIFIIIQICSNLPCPECTQHARIFWNKVTTANIKTKTDLINLLFVFHNMVNRRKRYPAFKYDDLVYYNGKNLIETYNSFARNFTTKGNMNLINESFHRNMMLSRLKLWMMENVKYFDI
jgi:hypothetical protein